jgi:hypothetical protein
VGLGAKVVDCSWERCSSDDLFQALHSYVFLLDSLDHFHCSSSDSFSSGKNEQALLDPAQHLHLTFSKSCSTKFRSIRPELSAKSADNSAKLTGIRFSGSSLYIDHQNWISAEFYQISLIFFEFFENRRIRCLLNFMMPSNS